MPKRALLTGFVLLLCQTGSHGEAALTKMTGDLLRMRQAVTDGKSSAGTVFDVYAEHAVRDGKLQCIVGATGITRGLVDACKDTGLEVVGQYQRPGLYQLAVRCSDPRDLDAIANRPDVRGIATEPLAVTNAGSVGNQADVSIHALDTRSLLGVDGSGVRVGVLSDSVMNLVGGTFSGGFLTGSAPQNTGDLPAQVRVLDPGPGNGTDEGAAMMELVHDLAPGCDLSFASASTGYLAFAANIDSLVTDPGFQCDILVDDILYPIEPVYQDGQIALAAEDAFAAGVAYFSSAGNQADLAHERDYSDVNAGVDDEVIPPNGNDLHDFGAAYGLASDTHLAITVREGGSVIVVLHWDEPYGGTYGLGPGAEANLALYLTDDTTLPLRDPDDIPGMVGPLDNVFEKSDTLQGAPGSPLGDAYEFIRYTNPSPNVGQTAYIVVDHVAGREPVKLHLMVFQDDLIAWETALLSDRTLYAHPAARNVMAVAATFYGEIDTGGGVIAPGGQLNVEPFSALGGNLPFYFPSTGSPRLSTPQMRFKPDITAPDGANTTFFGNDIGYDTDTHPNFFGTSAAAPHAAAVAALLLSLNPALSPTEIYDNLRATAVDAEAPGLDSLAGSGVIDALQAAQQSMGDPPSSNASWGIYE
jgi:subtilisin family serine protease